MGNLLYPPSLTINDDGITSRNWGRTKRLLWSDIQAINLQQITVSRYGNTKTKTTIQGGAARIGFMPLFGVAPAVLADYINQRRNKASPALNITVGNTAQACNMQGLAALAGVAIAALLVFHRFSKTTRDALIPQLHQPEQPPGPHRRNLRPRQLSVPKNMLQPKIRVPPQHRGRRRHPPLTPGNQPPVLREMVDE